MVTEHNLACIETIGNLSPHGVFIFRLTDRKFQFFNQPLVRILGINPEQLTNGNASVWNYLSNEEADFLRGQFSHLPQKRCINDLAFIWKINENTIVHLLCDCYYIKDEQVCVGFLKDISKEKQHENYIINYGSKKDSLLEILSHSLSGPLTLSQRVLDLTDKAIRKNRTQDVSSYIQFFKSTVQHCVDIITDFLKEEHFVSERIYVKQNRYDVIAIVQGVVDRFHESYPGRLMHFYATDSQLFVTGDDVKFAQVVNNLVSNAVKFTPPNCAIEIRVVDEDFNFTLVVKDDGIGIPSHLQPLVFQKYTPAGRPGLQGEKSIGVGLSIVKNLVSLMKGIIRFESDTDKGATFFVTLPKEFKE
jgi:two-component system sensor histidine kinase VicK